MDIVDRFRSRLSLINAGIFVQSLPSHEDEMAKTTQQLRHWVGGAGGGVKDERGIAVAVAAYLKSGIISSYRDAKYLCFGVTTPHAQNQKRIIEDETLVKGLLTHVKGYTNQPRKFRRCYQGIFRGYLRYPGHRSEHQIGQRCWRLMREFLADYANLVIETKPEVDWTATLGQHLNLLRENPCAPYGEKLLQGDHSVLKDLKEKLGIDDETWVMSELVLSQVAAATTIQNDDHFKSHISQLVTLLGNHPLLVNAGIAALLKRYALCDDRSRTQVFGKSHYRSGRALGSIRTRLFGTLILAKKLPTWSDSGLNSVPLETFLSCFKLMVVRTVIGWNSGFLTPR